MKKLIAIIAAALSFGPSGCADEDGQPANPAPTQAGEASERPAPRDITGTNLLPFVEGGGVTLIDVRREKEWLDTGMARGAIGATLQDADFVDQVLAALDGDKSRPVALICRSGSRSATAQKKLDAAGFTEVMNVTGGTLAWKKQGLPMQGYSAD